MTGTRIPLKARISDFQDSGFHGPGEVASELASVRLRPNAVIQQLLNQPMEVTDIHSRSTSRMIASKRLFPRMESTHSLC